MTRERVEYFLSDTSQAFCDRIVFNYDILTSE